ncbi:MAG: response regulator [Planctomycetota bacterium]|nr:response regulator [Planctomycetota bacterium]
MCQSVLVVDDSILMRRMIVDILVNDGWEIVGEAVDGADAVAQYKQKNPDIVTLDIVMPGTDGLEALQRIREYNPAARVVVVSALNQTRMISEAIRKGAADFITKPFLPEHLQETINAYRDDVVEV